jgi:hypothetical protein
VEALKMNQYPLPPFRDGALIHVSLDYATFGLLIDDDGLIVDAPPIAAWTLGRDQNFVARYYAKRGAQFTKL